MPIGDENKNDKDKLRYDLVPYGPLDELVRVYTVGASKYGDNTWQEVEPDRYRAALGRHFSKAMQGEVKSEDDGLYHWACVAWNALALLHFQLKEDDSTFIGLRDKMAAQALNYMQTYHPEDLNSEYVTPEAVTKCMEELKKKVDVNIMTGLEKDFK